VLDPLLRRVPFLARWRRPQFTRQDVLAALPFRNELIEWELRDPGEEEREKAAVVVLHIPRRQDRWGRLLNRVFEGPSHKQVILDELGTDVWQLCDGETTVDQLIRALAKKHKLERREVEVSLTIYLQTLAKRGFIGLRIQPAANQAE
jgi:coenzyme PQQ synthesis protein D (PqqD)